MATYNAIIIDDSIIIIPIRMVIFSGTVKDSDNNNVERDILFYKHDNNLLTQTRSNAEDGVFSLSVPCGSNDRIRVIAVGGSDPTDNSENSAIFDNILGA